MNISDFLHLYDTLGYSEKNKILMKTSYGNLSWRGAHNMYIYGKYPLQRHVKNNLRKIRM